MKPQEPIKTQRFYSPSMRGFYRSPGNKNIPDDAIKITDERYKTLRADQAKGLPIQPSSTGKPMAKKISITTAQLARNARHQRNQLLNHSDTDLIRAIESDEDQTALKAYRQALREVPKQKGFPKNIEWPEEP